MHIKKENNSDSTQVAIKQKINMVVNNKRDTTENALIKLNESG